MINRAIFDSGIFIGAKYPKDQYNKEALNIIDNFREGNIDKIYITNFVLLETVNFLLSKAGFEIANGSLNYLTTTGSINIVDIGDFKEIKGIFNKYKNLSITDCSLVALSEKYKIKYIFSFDKHFDSIKGLKRLTAI